jgi:hypothetical protein
VRVEFVVDYETQVLACTLDMTHTLAVAEVICMRPLENFYKTGKDCPKLDFREALLHVITITFLPFCNEYC